MKDSMKKMMMMKREEGEEEKEAIAQQGQPNGTAGRVLATKYEDQSSIPRTSMVEVEN